MARAPHLQKAPDPPVRRYTSVVIDLPYLPPGMVVAPFQYFESPGHFAPRDYLRRIGRRTVEHFHATRRPLTFAQVRSTRYGYTLYLRICEGRPRRRDLDFAERVRSFAVSAVVSVLRENKFDEIAERVATAPKEED